MLSSGSFFNHLEVVMKQLLLILSGTIFSVLVVIVLFFLVYLFVPIEFTMTILVLVGFLELTSKLLETIAKYSFLFLRKMFD